MNYKKINKYYIDGKCVRNIVVKNKKKIYVGERIPFCISVYAGV